MTVTVNMWRHSAVAMIFAGGMLNAAVQHDAIAADAVSFKDKTVTMIIADAPGGGTDATGRLAAVFLAKHLPGEPSVVPRNMPGASGMTALNGFVRQSKPDGLTILNAPNTPVDPLNYRNANVTYDLSKFHYIGGMWRGGTVMLINAEAEKRLYDKSLPPVVMGSIAAVPRSGNQITLWAIEYLGWNAKWVVGYPGTNEVMLALENGEVDMTATGNIFLIKDIVSRGKFKILNQSGAMEGGKITPRPDFGDAPLFTDQMAGKISDPVAKEAFAYWEAINALDKWVALPPDTPKDIIDTYRETYRKIAADPEFLKVGERISAEFAPVRYQDVEALVTTLVSTSPEAAEYMKVLMRKQGLRIE
jgi:hypothetical protein